MRNILDEINHLKKKAFELESGMNKLDTDLRRVKLSYLSKKRGANNPNNLKFGLQSLKSIFGRQNLEPGLQILFSRYWKPLIVVALLICFLCILLLVYKLNIDNGDNFERLTQLEKSFEHKAQVSENIALGNH